MRITRHLILAVLIFALLDHCAWKVNMAMMKNIFSHRDTDYTTEERQKAVLLDHSMTIYIIPLAVVSQLPVLSIQNHTHFYSSHGRALFAANAVIWTCLLYGCGVLAFAVFCLMKRRSGTEPADL